MYLNKIKCVHSPLRREEPYCVSSEYKCGLFLPQQLGDTEETIAI